jgi:hypothetical protein
VTANWSLIGTVVGACPPTPIAATSESSDIMACRVRSKPVSKAFGSARPAGHFDASEKCSWTQHRVTPSGLTATALAPLLPRSTPMTTESVTVVALPASADQYSVDR